MAGWPDAFVEIDRSGIVLEWNAGAEAGFGWRRDEVLDTFVTDSFLPGPFAKSPFGLLAADTTGASSGPITGSVTDGTLDLVLELRHRDGRRIRTEARLVVLGHGRSRSVAAFLRAPVEQTVPVRDVPGGPSRDGLTGLADRSAYRLRLAGATVTHAGTPGSVAVVLLDLDRFKAINNSMGHALGDGVLVVGGPAPRGGGRRRRPAGPVRRRRVPGPRHRSRRTGRAEGRSLRRPGTEGAGRAHPGGRRRGLPRRLGGRGPNTFGCRRPR